MQGTNERHRSVSRQHGRQEFFTFGYWIELLSVAVLLVFTLIPHCRCQINVSQCLSSRSSESHFLDEQIPGHRLPLVLLVVRTPGVSFFVQLKE